jgi:hypothetical protein
LDELMPELLHSGRKKHRPWTAQEQTTLEVAMACGVSFANIGQVLKRTPGVLHRKIGLGAKHRAEGRAPIRRAWTPQDQVNLEVAAACGIPISHLAILWKRSEAHLSAKLNHQVRESRKQSCRFWRKNNREHYLTYARHYSYRWRLANPERYKKALQANYQANRAKRLRQNLEWRLNNAQRKRQIDRQWYEANKDRVAARSKEYYERHKPQLIQAQKLWRQRNIERVRECARRHSARRRARSKPLVRATSKCISTLRALWNYKCAYCGKKGPLTDEHVFPVVYGGLDEIGNLVPACGTCNSSKQHKPVESWYRKQPFFTEARWRKIQRHCPAAVVGQLSIGA